jgi:hypothetical protein
LLQAIRARPTLDNLAIAKLQDRDSRQIVSLPCRRKVHEASGLYARHREPAYDSISGLKYVVNREQRTFLAGHREIRPSGLIPCYDACPIQGFRRISVQQHTRVVHIQVSVEVACVSVFDGVIEDFKIADRIDCQESPRLAKIK